MDTKSNIEENTLINSFVASDSMQEAVDMYEKRIYDLNQLLELSRSLCSTLEYSTLIESILYTCMCQMHVMGAGVFVLDDLDSNSFNLSSNHTGIDLDHSISYTLEQTNPLVQYLSKQSSTSTI